MAPKEKFATQVDPEILAKIRAISEKEGRKLQAIVEEALADLIEKREGSKPRPVVAAAYAASIRQFGSLYERLAR